MQLDQNTGDSGFIGLDLLDLDNQSAEVQRKCFAVQKSVNEGYFELDEALDAYKIPKEVYNNYLVNDLVKKIYHKPDETEKKPMEPEAFLNIFSHLATVNMSQVADMLKAEMKIRVDEWYRKENERIEQTADKIKIWKRSRGHRPSPRILIVEDDIALTNRMKSLVDPEFEIIQSSDFIKSVEIINREQPDIILLDIAAKNFNYGKGFEQLDNLKSSHFQYKCQVIFMLSDISVDILSRIKKGGYDYINKQIISSELRSKISFYIDHKDE